jgi:hypothetical protein
MAVGGEAAVGGHQRSSVGPSPVRWLLRIMPLLLRTMRRPMHRHRPMGRGGGVTPRSLITPMHRLAPPGFEPFSHGETETKTRIDDISASFAFLCECLKSCFHRPHTPERCRNPSHCCYRAKYHSPIRYAMKGLW